jgi:primosomal protein N' (replication factor Y)
MKESEPKVVEVIPILKGLPKPALSYFYRGIVQEGEFVEIEVRKSKTLAVVSKVRDAREMRSDLRGATFALKKLAKRTADLGVSRSFVLAAERTGSFYAASTGSVLGSVIPKLFLTEPDLLCFCFKEPERASRDPVVIQQEKEERFATYRSIVREAFARRNSVMLIAPTNELAERAFRKLSHGIEEYAYLFTLDKTRKTLRETLRSARSEKHPILFVTTASGLPFDRPDLSTIILDEEHSRNYLTRSRPHISIKNFVESFSKISGKDLILGDTVLSIETLWRERLGKFSEFVPLKWRVTEGAEAEIIDMKKLRAEAGQFQIFSPELKELVSTAIANEEQVFLFGARKGLSASTVCGDCGHLLECLNCGAPVVLHRKNAEENIYICHACGAQRSPETRCDNCSSWKLVPLGIGIDRIAEEASRLWPKTPLYIFDKDHVESARSARILAKKILDERQAIIIGTELYPLYRESIPYSGIVSLDALFAIPDFGIHERIFSLITKMREMTGRKMAIQTRNIGKDIITFAARGNILDFYKTEIADRENFQYPPFSIFIKVLTEAKEADLGKKAGTLKHMFDEWNPDFLKRRGATPNQYVLSMIIRVKRDEWPNKEIVRRLSLLTPDFLIKVDPESIL